MANEGKISHSLTTITTTEVNGKSVRFMKVVIIGGHGLGAILAEADGGKLVMLDNRQPKGPKKLKRKGLKDNRTKLEIIMGKLKITQLAKKERARLLKELHAVLGGFGQGKGSKRPVALRAISVAFEE